MSEKELKEEAKPKFKLPPRKYDVVYITNKYSVSEYAVRKLCDMMEEGKHFEIEDGRVKIYQVGLMRIGRIIKQKRRDGENLDLLQPDDDVRVVEAKMMRNCINIGLMECMLGDTRIVVNVKPFIRKNFSAGKPILVERIDDETYVAPPRINA